MEQMMLNCGNAAQKSLFDIIDIIMISYKSNRQSYTFDIKIM